MDLFVPKRAAAALLALSLIWLAALAPSTAEATFPGKPGLIAFNLLTFPGNGEPTGGLYAIEPGQPQPRQLPTIHGTTTPASRRRASSSSSTVWIPPSLASTRWNSAAADSLDCFPAETTSIRHSVLRA